MNITRNDDKILVEYGMSMWRIPEADAVAIRCAIAARVFPAVPSYLVSSKPRLRRMQVDATKASASQEVRSGVTNGDLWIESQGQRTTMSGADGLRLWRALDSIRTDIPQKDVEEQSIIDLSDLMDEDFKLSL